MNCRVRSKTQVAETIAIRLFSNADPLISQHTAYLHAGSWIRIDAPKLWGVYSWAEYLAIMDRART
jgi:hypothetical protein